MRRSKRQQLAELLAAMPGPVDRDGFAQLRLALAPVSDSHLRRLLKEAGHPLAPLVEGIRQDTPEALERTLLALHGEYASGRDRDARECVITARQHARWALRREASPWREEAILWMTVWLENPPVFPAWLRLRKATAARSTPPSPDLQ